MVWNDGPWKKQGGEGIVYPDPGLVVYTNQILVAACDSTYNKLNPPWHSISSEPVLRIDIQLPDHCS